jgi:GGDEF domain-containing protein
VRLGISAGASVYPYDGATHEELLADADNRMYRDKAARRRLASPQAATRSGAPVSTSFSPTDSSAIRTVA